MAESNPSIGWGLVGCSGWAGITPGPAVLAANGARLAAILTRDRMRALSTVRRLHGLHLANRLGGPWLAAKLRYGRTGQRLDALRHLGSLSGRSVRLYENRNAFLADPKVEAVWVVSPPHLHAEHAIAALEAGKHVLCEKPLATTAADARAIAEAARRSGRMAAVGYQMRQHPVHETVRREIREGRYGPAESLALDATLHFRHPSPPDWVRSRATSGGWAVCEAGTHLIDLALWFLGGDTSPVSHVEGVLAHTLSGFETDERATITIRFQSGSIARLDIAADADTPRQGFTLSGSHGKVRCGETLFGQGGSVERTTSNPGASQSEPVPAVDLYRAEVERFVEAIRGSADSKLATPEDGVRNLEVIERARGW